MADNNKNVNGKTVDSKEGGDTEKVAQGGGVSTGGSVTTSTKGAGMRERLKKKAEEANVNAAAKQLERLGMFDLTKASDMGVTRLNETSVKKNEGSYTISGRNIGAGQIEPAWTPEQTEMIKKMTSTVLEVVDIGDSRTSKPDAEGRYVAREEDGTVVATEEAFLSTLDPELYKLGAGQMKVGMTGGASIYVDIVVIAKDESWMINQPTSSFVVIDGVAENILANPPKAGAKNSRRIGHDFARVGLPKFAFGPEFNTLETNFPGILAGVKQSFGYYWLNASWGVSTMKGTYTYKNEEGNVVRTQLLSEVLRMIKGRSSLAVATLAISASFKARKDGDNWVPIMDTAGLSVKLHNAIHVTEVDYHGPPQTGSSGMMVTKSIMDSISPIKRPMTIGGIGGGGGSMPKGLFSNIGKRPSETNTKTPVLNDNDLM